MEDIIKTIEKMRVIRGITKRSLSIRAEISEEYYWRIVTGHAPGCSYDIISKLCQCVGIQLNYAIKIDVLEAVIAEKSVKKGKK